jgi:hypothetical protein
LEFTYQKDEETAVCTFPKFDSWLFISFFTVIFMYHLFYAKRAEFPVKLEKTYFSVPKMLKLFERVNKMFEAMFSDFDKGRILISKEFLLRKGGDVENRPFG